MLGCVPAATRIARARQRHFFAGALQQPPFDQRLALEPDRFSVTVIVDVDAHGREQFGKTDALLEGEGHFFVIERVARRILKPAAIGDGDAAPFVQHGREGRRAPFRLRRFTLRDDGLPMGEEFVGDPAFLFAHTRARAVLAQFFHEHIMAAGEFLDLAHVVGKRLGRGVDGRQAAADNDGGQTQLQVGGRILLGGAGELQRHQEIRCSSHARARPFGIFRKVGLPAPMQSAM